MAGEVAQMVAPVSEESPCGPDLFMEGDADAYNFEARIEGVLPESFFAFDRAAVDLPAEIALANKICAKSKDLRIISPLAKLHVLNRDFANFVHTVASIAELLKTRWDQLHPPYEGGEYCFRTIAVRALDDQPHTVLPLQGAPLFKTRRFGVVTHRAQLMLDGVIKPRKSTEEGEADEKVPSGADFRGAINDAEIDEVVGARDLAATLVAAINDIETTYDAAAKEGMVRLKALKPAAELLLQFLDSGVRSKDPSKALASEAAADAADGEATGQGGVDAGTSAGSMRSTAEAMNAIRAAFNYFHRREPSSPARLWLAQAIALDGKSFYDALQALTPEFASGATVKLGRDLPLVLPVERLAGILSEISVESDDVSDEAGSTWDSDSAASAPDAFSPDGDADEAAMERRDGDDGDPEAGQDSGDAMAEQPAAPASEARIAPVDAGPKVFRANTRPQAIQLIDQAGSYFRTNDPASPLPLLLDQARAMAGRDFLSLLRDVLPAHALRIDE